MTDKGDNSWPMQQRVMEWATVPTRDTEHERHVSRYKRGTTNIGLNNPIPTDNKCLVLALTFKLSADYRPDSRTTQSESEIHSLNRELRNFLQEARDAGLHVDAGCAVVSETSDVRYEYTAYTALALTPAFHPDENGIDPDAKAIIDTFKAVASRTLSPGYEIDGLQVQTGNIFKPNI